ncbi:MAG: hypothetical protein H6741_10375 [Alphaproteobacteria bacterium]|nr:hypothetical protein [Alphaproteobacteria bacterium]
MRWTLLALTLAACTPEPTPGELCEAEGAECCADADCGADEICHFSYTCYTRDGELRCSEPVGDKQCHTLCTEDTGLGDCPGLLEVCQTVEHVQGGDFIDEVSACF